MVFAGVSHPEDRLELVEGEILETPPQSSMHSATTCLVDEALRTIFAQDHVIRVQFPIALGGSSEPEPDIAVVTGRPRDYLASHPTTAALVVEVSDSSLAYDQGRKKALYAASGIPEYWIVNLVDNHLGVFRKPDQGTYQSHAVLTSGDEVSQLARPEASIPVVDLLP